MSTKREFQFLRLGNSAGPVLVCVPGLLGGPEDFANIIPALTEHFYILIANPIVHAREAGLNHLSAEILSEVTYDTTSLDIYESLKKEFLIPNPKHPGFYFLGVSLGGKVVYDFAIRFPDCFRGAIITDVGLSSFESSPLFKFVEKTVEGIDLNLPWPEMKVYLRTNIQENNLRVLIQTQVSYPTGKPPAQWKVGMQNFKALLQGYAIDEQFENFIKISSKLEAKNSYIQVLKADTLSGISDECCEQMSTLKCFKVHTIPKTAHFLHISHKDHIQNLIQESFK